MTPRFFETPLEFRRWLEENHETADELWVGFYKRATGRPSITWPESVDEALCFGWIDAIRKSLGEESYVIRFTKRRPTSVWSAVNLKRAQELIDEGRMWPAGEHAFRNRSTKRNHGYTYNDPGDRLGEAEQARLDENSKASQYFAGQTPSYKRMSARWVMSAKRDETRQKRLKLLIEASEAGVRLERYGAYQAKRQKEHGS